VCRETTIVNERVGGEKPRSKGPTRSDRSRGDLGFPDGATALRANLRQGCLQDFIDRRGAGGQAVAVAPVGLAGFAAGLLRL
jgi:hypothetical protein